MGKKCKIDDEFKNLIAPLSQEEYAALEASIRADGCLNAVVTWEGLLIDGHHRVEICRKVGKAFRITEKDFSDREAALLWIVSHQLARRNLTDIQRVKVALKQKELIASRAKPGKRTDLSANSPKGSTLDTREQIAKIAGVSSNTVSKVELIEKSAVPEIKAAAHKAAISIHAAATLASLPFEEQKVIAAAGLEALKIKAKQMHTEPPATKGSKNSDKKLIDSLKRENATLKAKIIEMESTLAAAEQEIQHLRDKSDDEIRALSVQLNDTRTSGA